MLQSTLTSTRCSAGPTVPSLCEIVNQGAFVFSGSELGFSWRLDYPSLPSARWIDTPAPEGSKRDYPSRSRELRPVQRLVENLIAHSTGLAPRG